MVDSQKTGEYEIAQHNTAMLRRICALQFTKFRAFLGVLVLVSQTAGADSRSHDTFMPYVGGSLKFDNNLLRLPDNVTSQESVGKNSKSDFVKQVRAGVDVDWKISRQQLLIKADLNQNWFDTYKELNYQGYGLLGQWNWELGRNLQGSLGYINKRSLGSFSQINRLINNLQTEEKYFIDGAYQIISDWYLQVGVSRDELKFSNETRRLGNRREDSLDIGLEYLNQAENMAGLRLMVVDGSYPQRDFPANSQIDNAYIRSSFHFEGAWHYSVKTRIDGRIGYTRQEYDHLKVRDFSAMTLRANIYWMPTVKTNLMFTGWREIAQSDNLTSSFVLSQGLRLIPSWSVTPKVNLNMFMSYEQQDFLGDPGFVDSDGVTQKDQIMNIGLNIRYKPVENAEISAVFKHEDRDSNNPLRSYQSQFGGLNFRLGF